MQRRQLVHAHVRRPKYEHLLRFHKVGQQFFFQVDQAPTELRIQHIRILLSFVDECMHIQPPTTVPYHIFSGGGIQLGSLRITYLIKTMVESRKEAFEPYPVETKQSEWLGAIPTLHKTELASRS